MKTKIRILIAGALLACSGLLFAVPLSVLIVQESEEIADSIRAFNKECAGVDDQSPKYTECFNKRNTIGGKLSGLVMLVQQELNFLGEPAQERAQLQEQQDKLSESQKAEILKQNGAEALDIDAEMKRSAGGRSDMRLHIDWAKYWFTCLGRENDSECTAFKAALVKATGPGGVGLMDIDHPTHEGNEEAKHWHAVKVVIGTEQDFVVNFVKALGSNDLNAQLQYYADPVNYYERRRVSKEVVRNDLEHDIATWPNRTYSITSPPKITRNNDGFVAEFRMKYTLTNPKGASSGTLQMTLRLRSQAPTWQVVGIQKKVIQPARER